MKTRDFKVRKWTPMFVAATKKFLSINNPSGGN